MKWYRIVLALALLSMAACVSPTGPQYPQPDKDNTTEKKDSDKGGMVIEPTVNFFV